MSAYLESLKKRMTDEGVEDLSGDIEPGMVESGKMTQRQFDVASREPGGANQGLDTVADAAIAFGGPKGAAIGLGLKTLQAVNESKRQQKLDRYKAEVARIQAKQDAINRLAQIGQGLKA